MSWQPPSGTILEIARSAGREPHKSGAEFLIHCAWSSNHANGDLHPSCRLNPDKNTFFCDVCQRGGGAKDLAEALGVRFTTSISKQSTASRKLPLVFRSYGPIPETLQDMFAGTFAKAFSLATWKVFGVLAGRVYPEGLPDRAEDAIAFPLPSGGHHIYRYRRAIKRRRWGFSDGGHPDVLIAGWDRDDPVLLCEGEWDAMRAYQVGLAVATGTGGAGTFNRKWADRFVGRDVVTVYDVDPAGRAGGERAASAVSTQAKSVRLLHLPLSGNGDTGGKDLRDYLDAHGGEALRKLFDTAVLVTARGGDDDESDDDSPLLTSGEEPEGKVSQASRLVQIVEDTGAVLFHDEIGNSWCRIVLESHAESWSTRSKNLRRWLAGLFWKTEKRAPNSNAISSGIAVLESKGRFDGPKHVLHNRVAFHQGALWYDLTDAAWRAVRVDGSGWKVVADPPVLFRRHAHQAPQVEPQPGGDLHKLLSFLNIADPKHQILLLVYIVSCLVPDIPHPIPVLHGPQGAAKTTLLRMLRRLVDPSVTETLTIPRDPTELVQQLSHHWAAYYDNLTGLPEWISDALCRATTGEGFSKRELYTDDEDVIYSFRRCVGLNGINIAAHKPDLLDRCLLFQLDEIKEENRRPEKLVWRDFEAVRPHLFGATLDALSIAMREYSSVALTRLPRMADFALWGCAIAAALGHRQEDFLSALDSNCAVRNEEVVASNPVATCVAAFMEDHQSWSGTPSDLLKELEAVVGNDRVRVQERSWPKTANVLSRRLTEVMPNLAAIGIRVHTGGRTGKQRLIKMEKGAGNIVTGVTAVIPPEESSVLGDDTADPVETSSPISSHGSANAGAPCDDGDGNDDDLQAFTPRASSPPRPLCSACGSFTFWRSAHGETLCQLCGRPSETSASVDE